MIPLDDARREVLAACPPLPVVTVSLRDALGHVTAEDVHAAEEVPPFDNSAVDGFAVRAVDVTTVAGRAAGGRHDRRRRRADRTRSTRAGPSGS